MDLYEIEVEKLLEEGGIERLKRQFMNLSRRLDKVSTENKELKKQISELETKLEHSKEYTEALRRMLGLRSAKENIELANKLYGLNFEVPDDEEPLSFSSDEYEEDRIDKIEKAVLGIQSFLKKETEQKIEELEEKQERLMRETAYQRFISDLVRPLKP